MYAKRSGVTGYCLDYKPELVTISGSRVTLQASRIGSAGVMGPMMQNGVYEFLTYGRYDILDPSVVFSIWFYNDTTKDEIDLVEYYRSGDPNNPKGYHIKWWINNILQSDVEDLDRCFYQHKIICVVTDKTVTTYVYGDQLGNWIERARMEAPRRDFGQLRMAVWTPKAGYTYRTGISPSITVVTKFTPQ